MDTISYILFALDMISGTAFVLYSLYVFFRIFRTTAANLKRRLTKLGSKILSDKIYKNLQTAIHSQDQQQQTRPPTLQFPISIQSDEPIDPTGPDALSSERIMSTDRPLRHLLQVPKLGSEDFLGTERIITTERPLRYILQIPKLESEDNIGSERKENSFTELPVFSPINLTGADLLSFNLPLVRGVTIPAHLQSVDSPAEDLGSHDLSEILENEIANSPPASVNNKTSKVLKFRKENWNDALSKNSS